MDSEPAMTDNLDDLAEEIEAVREALKATVESFYLTAAADDAVAALAPKLRAGKAATFSNGKRIRWVEEDRQRIAELEAENERLTLRCDQLLGVKYELQAENAKLREVLATTHQCGCKPCREALLDTEAKP